MEHGFLDRYSGIVSPVHRLDSRLKILLTVAFVLITATTPPRHLFAFVLYAGFFSWAVAWSNVPARFVVGQAILVLPFSALVAAGLPFFRGGETTHLCGMDLSVEGLWMLVGAAMKSFLGAAAVILLISTTRFTDLLAGLRRMGAPTIFTDLLALTYRYLFVLTDEAMRTRRAAWARGYCPRWLPEAIIVGRMCGRLFVRSHERAERMYGAMLLRGYHGVLPGTVAVSFRHTEIAVTLLLLCVLVLVRLFVA